MTAIIEGRLQFDFPDDWQVSKLDTWSFYRNQFAKLSNTRLSCSKCGGRMTCALCDAEKVAGTKACDVLAIEPGNCAWLVEVKDYRRHVRTKVIDLANEIALKVRDSLALLVAAKINAADLTERQRARAALRRPRMRIVLHLEQPEKHSTLFPRAIDPADVLLKLKQLVKPIDPHPCVVEIQRMAGLNWQVTGV